MYRQNSLWLGLCSIFGFIITINSFFMDTISTAQNLAWLMDWVKNSSIDKYINQLFSGIENLVGKIQTFVEVMGFWFVLLPILFLFWRNHARN